MEHINFSIKKNLIYLKINNNENVFNNGLVYFLNLDNFKNFFHITDINNIPNEKNYIIFVNKFKDNLEILEKLKNKFKLIAINLSLKCFWFFFKLDTRCEEKIIYDTDNFDIKLKLNSYFYKQINNQLASNLDNKKIETKKNFILENIDSLELEIKQYKERILNESVEKLNSEYIKIKKKIKKFNQQIKNLDISITKLEYDKQINTDKINKENFLQDIRELKKIKIEINKVIKNFILDNIDSLEFEIKQYKERTLNESIEKLSSEYIKIKKKIEKFNQQIKNLDINIIKSYSNKQIRIYEINKENILQKIRELKKIKIKFDKIIKNNNNIFKTINFKIQEEQKIKERKKNHENKLLLLKNKNKNIAIFVHLYNINLWKDIYLYILNLKKFDMCIDLYVNIAVNNEKDLLKNEFINLNKKIEEINWFNKVIITNNNNKGMDSGGFLTSYLKVLELKKNYDFIIKIHSKSNDNWRNLLLYSLLGNDKIIQNNLNLIDKKNIGMIGYQTMSLNENLPVNNKSYKFMDEYLNLLNVEKKNNGFFIPGTIFIIKDYILKEYFTEEIISKIYKNFKSNYCGLLDNKLEERPHALERLYGLLVYNMNLNVISYDKN